MDVSNDIYAIAKSIHGNAATALLVVEAARSSNEPPTELATLLEKIQEEADLFANAYRPSEDVHEAQPVVYEEPESGWNFDAWMWEKIGVIQEQARHARDAWKYIVDSIAEGRFTWSDAAGDFVSGELGDTPVNRREEFESCVGEVEVRAGTICELIATRLTAKSPGQAGREPPPIR